jgi:glycosyltransferase involved in cell wall biosynthesis
MQNLVSILIPVYNAERTVGAAIQSCLDQTYPHIEVILLDNDSDDRSMEIINSFDSLKISVLRNKEQMGIASSRNTLLQHARGEYIAWLDADDTMNRERIDQQVAFMEAHPGIDIAGTWIQTDNKNLPYKKLPLLHNQIRSMLWFKNCMIQPSIISKNFYKKENIWYDKHFNNSVEDYELWYRLSSRKKFANIPQFLTVYHMTTGDALAKKQENNAFKKNINLLWQKKWQDVNLNITSEDQQLFQDFMYTNQLLSPAKAKSLRATLTALRHHNKDPFCRLIISFHQLRLWKNMALLQKLSNLSLLYNLLFYFKMKRNYLF